MWPFHSLLIGYFVVLLVHDVGAKICTQNHGRNVVTYMNCYGDCCGDWYYRYCCASGTINLYAICAGVTLLGVLVILIIAVCCRYHKRRARQRSRGNNPRNRNAIPSVTQPQLFSEPPVYSVHDTFQGYANTAFHADVVTQYEYMKPPEYQKDPPAYEKDPPAYSTAVTADQTESVAESSTLGVAETGHSSSVNNAVASHSSNTADTNIGGSPYAGHYAQIVSAFDHCGVNDAATSSVDVNDNDNDDALNADCRLYVALDGVRSGDY